LRRSAACRASQSLSANLHGENLPRQLIIDEHRDIADAALARDADRAAMLLGRHMVITSDFYARVLSAKDPPEQAVGTDAVSPELA